MKKSTLVAVLVAALFLVGCDFVFKHPVTATPSHDVDQRLVGNWANYNSDGAIVNRVKITSKGNKMYLVDINQGESQWIAWSSDYTGAPPGLFTLRSARSDGYGYAMVKVIDDNTFAVEIISGDSLGRDDTAQKYKGYGLNSIQQVQTALRKLAQAGKIFRENDFVEFKRLK